MDKIKLIIFDLDDTLIRSGINYTAIREEIYELFPPDAQVSNLQKTPILILASQLKLIDEQLYLTAKRLIERSEEESVEKAKIMEGAENIPEILEKNDIQSVIYTNNTQKTVNLYFEKPQFHFLKHFEFVTRDDVKHPKPNPEGILTILNKKSTTKDNTAYIGDSYIDAGAARKAGIRFILFDSRNLDLNTHRISPFATIKKWSEFERIIQ
ncbi:MAG: HAD family hydrolase [Candidatus Hodarchaeales archaeon]